jgi:hypothetical protein
VASDPALAPFDADAFWEDLLLHLRHRRVIPVVGAELLTIQDNDQVVALYRAVAQRLLKKYGLSSIVLPEGAVLRQGHELNDAVCALAATGHRIKDLYPRIADILDNLLAEHKEALEPLRELTSILDFDLFVTTTPDNLLARALDATRFGGADLTHQIKYAPNLPFDPRNDIPETLLPQYIAVFYLFGRADVCPFYAIHDEDTLEFLYTLPNKGPERMLAKLQNRDLLLIGCTFYDWLSRFFIRTSNSVRLSLDRDKKEFLVGDETAGDRTLSGFLRRFSQDSRCYPGDARAFIAELNRRWRDIPHITSASVLPGSHAGMSEPGELGGGIFISYAHEDIAAARTLFTDLQTIGGAVAWFDKTELKPGDIWDSQILRAIERCHLFLPLLSVTSEQREEGYFKREWKRAAARYEGIIGRKFIFPIVIDPDYTGDMTQYKLVPDVFKSFQYGHAPAGHMSSSLRDEITQAIRDLRRPRTV